MFIEQDERNHIKHEIEQRLSQFDLAGGTILECKRILDESVSKGALSVIYDKIESNQPISYHRSRLLKKYLQYRQAQQAEICEDFEFSQINYEKSGMIMNIPRIIMKNFLKSAKLGLEKYCLAFPSLNRIWSNYLIASGQLNHAAKYYMRRGELGRYLMCSSLLGNLGHEESKMISKMTNQIQSIMNRQIATETNLEFIIDNGLTLSNQNKSLFAEMASQNLISNYNRFANSNIYLLLNCCELSFNHTSPDEFMYLRKLLPSSKYALYCLIDNVCGKSLIKRRQQTKEFVSSLFNCCEFLGLTDESLRILSHDMTTFGEHGSDELKNRIQNIIDNRPDASLFKINPYVGKLTVKALLRQLTHEGCEISATNVITIVILSITVSILKLNYFEEQNQVAIDESALIIEDMFSLLTRCFNDLEFSATNHLVCSANNLIKVLKSKLEVFYESVSIRDDLRNLVETVASKCTLEGQYKSAALLYSQIEDSINAIKSLMRTGEVESVIKYALLVKDITVNRITINYLRHMNLSSESIENFIAQTKI